MKPKSKIKQKKSEIKDKNIIKKRQYAQENLMKALEAIGNGMSKKQAAKVYQVPRATLQFRLKNPNHKPQPGPGTVLSEEEETSIIKWLITSSKKGFPKRKEDVINSVSSFLSKNERPNPFKKNIPGEKWYKLFLKRHPEISTRTPESVTAASAAVSENDVKKWFHDIATYLKDNDLFEVLSDPNRVFNGDESNFVLCPKSGVVLALRGEKNVYEVDHAQAKTSLTVMFTFCANGETTPPMVIFPYKRLPGEIASKIPSEWGIGLSDNGWMKAEIFYDYIKKVLHPHLVKTGTQFPIILFVDGHKTHLTFAVSELCTSLNIVLIALYPNSTRLLQPADVSAFRPLKGGWQKTVLDWRRNNPAQALKKSDFVPLLQKTIKDSIKPQTIMNGFRTTGLYPWNPDAIDYTKCLGKIHTKSHNLYVDQSKTESKRLMKKDDFINIVGRNMIKKLETEKKITGSNKLLQKLWNFFNEKQTDSSGSITCGKADNTDSENMEMILSEQKEVGTNIYSEDTNKKTGETYYNKEIPSEKTINCGDIFQNGDIMDIENMEVILSEQNEQDGFANCLPVSHEVTIEEFLEYPTIEEITALHDKTDLIIQNDIINDTCSQDDSQNIDHVQVTHTVEVYNHENNNTNLIINNMNRTKQIARRTVNYTSNHDFNKIEVLDVKENPTIATPLKTNLKKVNLNDLLILPKTPNRKGVKNTKKTTFVVTSEEFKAEELKKKKEKEEKEEGIKKRKEEREQKKLQAAAKRVVKKENLPKSEKKIYSKQKTKVDVKKILFSEDFTNLNVDISLKPIQSKKKEHEESTTDIMKNTEINHDENFLNDNVVTEKSNKQRGPTKTYIRVTEIENMLTE